VLRMDDLDGPRCRPEFAEAALEDLRWFGIKWEEGPDVGGPRGPYVQSARMSFHRAAFDRLGEGGHLFPCVCSRRDILEALSAPHEGDEEPVYPGTCRGRLTAPGENGGSRRVSWRFRVPDGEAIEFVDGRLGPQRYIAGRDFGDFVVWRSDGLPSYQLACVVDDAAMGVTEVVRGADLLSSTARQLLLYRALGLTPPRFFHCPLVRDETGRRLAKRHDALSLRALRAQGMTPEGIRELEAFKERPA
jgi:glutamyl/glutaminyl-tRNA synthetase